MNANYQLQWPLFEEESFDLTLDVALYSSTRTGLGEDLNEWW